MRFEVIFHTTYNGEGKRIGHPDDFLMLPEGIVLESMPVRTEPPAEIEEPELLDGEDRADFVGTETWEYEVEDGRVNEFLDALRNCPLVIEYSELPAAA